MEILAYALFILVMAAPFLVIAAIASAFLGGIAGIVAGIAKRRGAIALLGVVLMAASGAAAMVIQHWATTTPADTSTSTHRVVYKTYQEMRMQYRVLSWLRGGGFERLSEEQRARDAKKRAKGE